MASLSNITGKELIKFVKSIGYRFDRQNRSIVHGAECGATHGARPGRQTFRARRGEFQEWSQKKTTHLGTTTPQKKQGTCLLIYLSQ